MTTSLCTLAITCCLASGIATGAEVTVEPGKGTIQASVATIKPGDTIRLKGGTYQDSITLPGDCTLIGEGPGKTILTTSEYAAVNIGGANVRISGIEFQKSGDVMRRGVASELPVYVSQCRFNAIPEAVALRSAPLCDVVHCEFIDCGIGVRSIGGSSPTVSGCLFQGGRTGIFAREGGPNIRNNVFAKTNEGIRLTSKEPHVMVIRNNVFVNCGATAIMVLPSQMPIGIAAIRNNIFRGQSAAITGPAELLTLVSHNIVDGVNGPAFRDKDGKPSVDVEKSGTTQAQTGAEIDPSGQLKMTAAEELLEKGARQCDQLEGTQGRIGLSKGIDRVGCNVPADLKFPGPRWIGPRFVANSVGEEYLCLRLWNARLSGQGLLNKDGRSIDKQMEKTTWRDAKVIAWVQDNAIAA